MKTKKMNKVSKRRIIIFSLFSLAAIIYFCVNSLQYVLSISKLTKESRELNQKLVSLKTEETELKNDIVKLKDPDYIARYARVKYFYSKDGEYVIQIPEEEDGEDVESKDIINYKVVVGASALALIFILIIKKK